jgi:hypothetical protein
LISHPDRKIALVIPEMLDDIRALADARPDLTDPEFPIVLSAGERRAFTANDILRDPSWRKRDADGQRRVPGVAPNALTSTDWRDPYAGTPWHKHVPAHIEALPAPLRFRRVSVR